MKRKKSLSVFLSLLICFTLVFNSLIAFGAESGTTEQQSIAEVSESSEADNEESLLSSDDTENVETPSDSSEEEEELENNDTSVDSDTEGDLESDSDDSADEESKENTDEYAEEGSLEASDEAASEYEEDGIEEFEISDGFADTSEGSYEYSDPDLESGDGQNTEETPVEEIVEEVSTVGLTAEMAAAAVAPTSVWVEATEENGLPIRIDGFKVANTSPAIFQIYLPANINPSNCFLSWDGGAQARVSSVDYNSGACPLPTLSTVPHTVNTGTSYEFRSGNSTLATFNIMAYQGSPNVKQIFIDIDESQGTIEAMDTDHDHNTSCVGRICIDGTWYEMPQIKGRGNYTWWQARDKRAYNITLDSKTTLGLDTPSTKKWSILAEIADHSLLCNRSGFWLAHEIGIGQDTRSADVWMNGEYQGCYTLTPKYDSFVTNYGYMIEQDNYLEDEGGDPQFKLDGMVEPGGSGGAYNRITVKKMGDGLVSSAGGEAAAAEQIRVWLQDAWDAIRSDSGYNSKNKYYTDYIDIESFAKMYLMHEYVKSYDVCAGSILFHRDGNTDSDKLIADPLWDLDNAMGSTGRNYDLGSAGDRRSGADHFLANIVEYKTSIYKTLRKHEDFMAEVTRQYNKHKSSFDSLPDVVDGMISSIEVSAKMNHFKVGEVGYNNHKYGGDYSVGSGEYRQTYYKTNDRYTDWPIYAANLLTYITTRSRWFANNYYDPDYVDPETCDHQYEPHVIREASCTATGIISYICPICKNHYEEETPQLQHDYQDGVCTMCGQRLTNVTISCPEGASVTVLETQDPEGPKYENAESANPRNSDTGWIDCSGDGQVNFIVNIKPGYELVAITAEPSGSYKNFKTVDEAAHIYRYTKVTGDFTISVDVQRTDDIILHSANVEFEGKLQLVFTLNLPDSVKNDTSAYVRFVKSGTTVDIPVSEGIASGSFTVFELPIKIPEFGDDVTITVCNGEGDHYSVISESGTDYTDGCTYSVEEYAIDKQEDEDSSKKMKQLAEALEDYGTVTQLYFKYGDYEELVVNPRVAAVTDEELAGFEPIIAGSLPAGVQKATIAVASNEDNTLRITYYLDQNKTASDYVFQLDGNTVMPKERTAHSYCIDIENIAAPNLDVLHMFTITGGGVTYSVNCSALTYAWVMKDHSEVEVQNLGKVLYLYNKAANEFFGQ